MKINFEVDCTPEEARRAVGLPDLTPIHDRYIGTVLQTMEKGISPDMVETMMKSWAPMGDAGMAFWRRLFESAGKSIT